MNYPALDGLRALAITLVLVQHATYGQFPGGFVGVDVFFVLSGFLITRVLLRPSTTFSAFYLRRAQRLMPALAIMLMLAYVLWPLSVNPSLSFWRAALPVIFYVADIQACLQPALLGPMLPTWSLAVEEQFYLIWPLGLALLNAKVKRSRRIGYVFALAAAFTFVRPLLYYISPILMRYFSPLTRIDVLLVGCAIGIMQAPPRFRSAAYLFIIALPFVGRTLQSNVPLHYLGVAPFVTAGAVGLIGECVRNEPSQIKRVLSWSPFVWLGRRSYGIYLYHLPIFEAFEHLRRPHSFVNYAIVSGLRFAATLAFAELSYRLVERPILRMRPAYAGAVEERGSHGVQ